MEDYIIITWKDGYPVWLASQVAEIDAYTDADKQLHEMEGDYTTIHSAKDGVLTEINRLTRAQQSKEAAHE